VKFGEEFRVALTSGRVNFGVALKLEANMHLKKWNVLPAIVAAVITVGPISVSAQALTVLHSFNGSDGQLAESALVQGTDGNFYGTTALGGDNHKGTVFKIDATGNLTTLHSFSGFPNDGATPIAGLVQGSDGNFYGTTALGGMFYQGTLFRITPAGAVTIVHSFSGLLGDGSVPMGGLVQTTDGSLFGTTALGGTHSMGAVFRTALGIVVTLHSFSGSPVEGANPTAKLVRGSDGNFYGTTVRGGAQNRGTAFKISALGSFTMLHSFNGAPSEGANPVAGLVQGSDGNFYGTTGLGGGHYLGTAFNMTPAGGLTTLHSFTGSSGEGASPLAGLVQASDGNFYGTTALGGAHFLGTLFKITPAGNLTTLHSLSGSPGEGASPVSALLQGNDGNFYGTTALGGAHYWGTVFKFSLSAPAPAY
jgi:uncharacterized repeat protein (TIGR03803 family)